MKQVNHKLTNLIHEKEDFICQLEKDKADLQQEKALIQQSFESSKKVWEKTLIDQQNQFRVQSKEMEHNFHVQQSNVAEDLKTSLSKEFQQRHQSKVQDISQSFQIEIQGLHTQLQRKQLEYQHLNQDYQQLKNRWEQVTAGQDVLLAKDIFNNHLQQVAFKYPSKTQSTQTEIDFEEEGLWDKQHGWILPISKNCLIRKKWRQVLNYSRCPSCHGNGQFISQVASILRQSTMGGISNNTAYLIPAYLPPANTNKTGNSGKKAKKKSMTKTDHAVVDNSTASNADHTPKKQSNASKSTDAIMTPTTLVEGNVVDNKVPHYITNTYKDTLDYDTLRDMMMHGKKTPYFVDDKYNGHYLQYAKIRMPDDLIHFLTNLPHAIQAMHNMSSIWTIAMTYAIMHYKYFFADREDCKHHFTIQSMAHYVIVHFLQYLPYNRIYSEYILYIYLRSMKTYYPQSHLLSIMLRAMEVLDEYSSTEKSLISQYLQQSQDILQRKKHALLQNMKIRDRQKALQQQEEQQSSAFAGQNSQAITSALVAKSIYDEEYALSSHALSTEVNEVMLFARHCLLYSPYKGVYRKPIDHVASQFPEFFNKFESVMNAYTSDMWKTVVDQYQHLPSISRMHSVDPNDFHTNADRPRDMQYIALPKHVLCPMYPTGSRHNDNAGYQLHHFYMPLDRAVHVLQAFIEQINQPIVIHHHVDIYQHTAPSTTASKVVMNAVAIMKVFRSLEETTVCLHSDGSIYTPDGLNTFIRSTMRLFIQAYKPHCVDISTWDEIANLYRRQGADAEGSTDEVNSSSRAIFASSLDKDEKSTKEINLAILMTEVVKYTLMVDMDYVLLLLIQIIQQRVKYIESTLYKLFIDGDVNHDNVLSYTEFRDIVLQIPNHDGSLCPERKIIRMFRDALSQGQDNDCIGPEAFVDVCKKYQIIDLVSDAACCSIAELLFYPLIVVL